MRERGDAARSDYAIGQGVFLGMGREFEELVHPVSHASSADWLLVFMLVFESGFPKIC